MTHPEPKGELVLIPPFGIKINFSPNTCLVSCCAFIGGIDLHEIIEPISTDPLDIKNIRKTPVGVKEWEMIIH